MYQFCEECGNILRKGGGKWVVAKKENGEWVEVDKSPGQRLNPEERILFKCACGCLNEISKDRIPSDFDDSKNDFLSQNPHPTKCKTVS